MYFGAPGTFAIGGGDAGMLPQVPLEQPKQVFRYGEQSLWSSAFFAAAGAVAQTETRLFTTPVGQVGQNYANALSLAETNLRNSGQIPNGVAYDVFGISLGVNHFTGAVDGATQNKNASADADVRDLLNILNNCVVSWVFTQTIVNVAPAMLIGQGGGAFGAVGSSTTVAATTTATGHMNNGNGSVWVYRKYPVALPGSTTFGVLLNFGSRAPVIGATPVSVRATLLGFYKNLIEIA